MPDEAAKFSNMCAVLSKQRVTLISEGSTYSLWSTIPDPIDQEEPARREKPTFMQNMNAADTTKANVTTAMTEFGLPRGRSKRSN